LSEEDNVPAWEARPGTYEVWFLTCSDRSTGTGYWLRSTLVAPKEGPPAAGAWFARFDLGDPGRNFGIHRRYDLAAAEVATDTFRTRIGDSTFASGLAEGSLEGPGHQARWRLEFPTGAPTHRLLPAPLYRAGLAPSHPCSPNVDTSVSGTLEIDGETVELRDVAAQQGHVHGRRHAERWAWAHCADFVDEEAVIHAVTAQTRRGPLTTPFVTSIGVRWKGRWLRLNRFSRKRDFGLGTWRIDVGNRRYRLTGRIESPARAMVRARYEDPDGSERYCHNSETASCRLALFERRAGGFEEVVLLESRGTTHAEWAGRTPASAVEHEHMEIGA
jgi:hypothetical protein